MAPGPGGARQRPAGRRDQPARGRARGGRARAAALRRAGAVRLAGVPGADPPRGHRAVRGRRGALRLPVGARLPARLLPARRRRALARREGDHGLDRDGHAAGGGVDRDGDAAGGADIVQRLGLRDPVHVATGFDRPNLSFAVVPCPTKEAVHRGIAATLERARARCPAIVYAGTRAESDRLSQAARLRARRGDDRLPRGPRARGARGGAAALHGRRGAAGRGDQRVRHGRRQGRRADGLPRERPEPRSRPTTRRPAARGATGSRPAACCSRPAATRGCTSSSSSARRSATTS